MVVSWLGWLVSMLVGNLVAWLVDRLVGRLQQQQPAEGSGAARECSGGSSTLDKLL